MQIPLFERAGDGIFCIDALYLEPGNACCYLLEGGGDLALIETGTAHSVDNILGTLAELDLEPGRLRYIIPTHVHLDHAGGAGALMERFPSATLLIHPRGARHMIDPQRLIASAQGVYGADAFRRLYGEIRPIDAERVRTLADGESVTVGDRRLRVRHTRGHADHHFCLFDEGTRGWFSGDMFGVSYRRQRFADGSFVMPTTTPTQFEPELYRHSVKALIAEQPDCFYLTHYGALAYAAEQAEALSRQLYAYEELVERAGTDLERLAGGVKDIARSELERLVSPDLAADLASQLEMDARLNAQGLAWWRQQAA